MAPSPEQPLPEPTTLLPPPAQDSAQDLHTPPESRSRRPRNLFFGPFGLRAGWSLLLYFIILGVIGGSLFGIGHLVHIHQVHTAAAAAAKAGKPAPPPPTSPFKQDTSKPLPMAYMILGESFMFALFLFTSWLMSRIEHRKFSSYGLGGAHRLPRLLTGAAWGLAAISLLILTLRAFHLLAFDTLLDHGPRILFWGALQLLGFLLVGFTEEYSMRGYLQFTLTRGFVSLGNLISPQHARTIAFWIAAAITSTLFFMGHIRNPGENWLGLLQVFLAGVVFVLALWRTGSLWWGIGFHMAWDWGQSFLFGVPDSGGLEQGRLFATHALGNPLFSGGTVGPEGSVLCVPIFLLAIVVLFFTHPSPQPPPELPNPRPNPDPPPQETTPYPNTPAAIA
jgi:membrane protease YdiL (CAAX protease family)